MMRTKIIGLTLVLLCILHLCAISQNTIPINGKLVPQDGYGPTRTLVKLDPITRIPIGNIPFDRTFILRIYFDPAIDLKANPITGFFLISKSRNRKLVQQLGFYLTNSEKSTDYDASDNNLKAFPNAIDVVVPALYPNEDYKIVYSQNASQDEFVQYLQVFKLFYDNKIHEGKDNEQSYKISHTLRDVQGQPILNAILTGDVALTYYKNNNLKSIFNKYNGDLAKATSALTNYISTHHDYPIPGNNTAELFEDLNDATAFNTQQYTVQTSAALAIVADGGLIFTGFQKGFNTVSPYVGINLSFRPLDSDIPFRLLVRNKRIKWYQRITANFGLTLNSIAKTNYRSDIFGSNNIMVGIGYKFSHVINLSIGGLIYNNVDSNPLLDKKTVGVAPYIGLSINLKIKDALGDLAKVFSYGK